MNRIVRDSLHVDDAYGERPGSPWAPLVKLIDGPSHPAVLSQLYYSLGLLYYIYHWLLYTAVGGFLISVILDVIPYSRTHWLAVGVWWGAAMDLSDEAINDFMKVWQADFGEVLSPEAARLEASRLLDFFVSMNEEAQGQSAVIPLPPELGGQGDIGDVVRQAWRKTMQRVDSPRPMRESL